jgi:hypothetical protein
MTPEEDRTSTLKPGDRIGGAHTPDLRRVERAIVRGLRDEFGKGMQHQLTHAEGFDIAIAGTDVIVEVREESDEHVESSLERYERALRFIAQGNLNHIADLGAAGALAEVTNAALEALDGPA